MNTKNTLLTLTIAIFFFASCQLHSGSQSISGSGKVTTEKREVEASFKAIEISRGLHLVLEQSESTEIVVETDDNLQNSISTIVKGGVLEISTEGSINNLTVGTIYVKMPVINNLDVSSAATVKSSNILKGKKLKIESSSASKMDLDVDFNEIECSSSSASSITLKGKALKLIAESSSASKINATKLFVNNIESETSSASEINVSPIESLSADASSSGTIKYYSEPKIIKIETSSGGRVRKM